jgi:hypothetical protein
METGRPQRATQGVRGLAGSQPAGYAICPPLADAAAFALPNDCPMTTHNHLKTKLPYRLNWRLVAVLAAVALVRPIFSIVGLSDSLGKPATPLILTGAISLVWILAAGLGRISDPLPTLVAAGMTYALAATVLSGILSPILTGSLQGPLAAPLGIISVFIVNAAWGAACGACAIGLRRLRRGSAS